MSWFIARDPLDAKAEKLVPFCKTWAITSFTPAMNQFQFIQACKPDDWDFFATVASVTVALQLLTRETPPERFKHLNGISQTKLKEWDARAPSAAMDCMEFVYRTMERVERPEGKLQQAFGLWVIWNLLQRQPTREEFDAVNPIGTMLAEPFHDWWH